GRNRRGTTLAANQAPCRAHLPGTVPSLSCLVPPDGREPRRADRQFGCVWHVDADLDLRDRVPRLSLEKGRAADLDVLYAPADLHVQDEHAVAHCCPRFLRMPYGSLGVPQILPDRRSWCPPECPMSRPQSKSSVQRLTCVWGHG